MFIRSSTQSRMASTTCPASASFHRLPCPFPAPGVEINETPCKEPWLEELIGRDLERPEGDGHPALHDGGATTCARIAMSPQTIFPETVGFLSENCTPTAEAMACRGSWKGRDQSKDARPAPCASHPSARSRPFRRVDRHLDQIVPQEQGASGVM